MNMQAGKPFALARRLAFALLTSLLCVVAALAGSDAAHAQSPLDGFAPDFNNEVRALALQSNGKLLVGGAFTQIGTIPRNRLVRLDPTGALDTVFSVSVNQTVHALAVDAGDRVLVGGAFTQIGSTSRNHIARLGIDGALDTSFNPNIDGTVYALRVLDDGGILVAGDFLNVGGVSRPYLARLDSSGALEPTFAHVVDGPVYALAIQRGGALVIGGAFTQVNSQPRQHIARFASDGTLDAQFAPNLNGTVRALTIGVGDEILAGGEFTTVDGAARGRLARFTAAGVLASTPALTFDNTVHTLLTLADGRVVVGGAFTTVNSQARAGLVRLALDFSLDPTFAPDPNAPVYALLSQPDDKFVAGGAFTAAGGQARRRAARFYTDGSLDANFAPSANGEASQQVAAIAIQQDGRIVVGGTFTEFDGQTRQRLARFFPDGRLDASFDPGADSEVQALAIQPDGKIVVAGNFTQIAGQNRPHLARLLPDGQLDQGFAPFPYDGVNSVRAILLQRDGKILAAIEPREQQDRRSRLIRLNADGTLDTTFQSPIDNNYVVSLALQPDGKVIACGGFRLIQEDTIIEFLARLNPSGEIDQAFVPDVSICRAIALLPDGRILFSGTSDASTRTQHPGNLTQRLIRINTNAVTDTGFTAEVNEGYVSAFAIQSDGKILVANNYEDAQSQNRGRILRLTDNGSADSSFVVRDANGPILAVALQKDGKPVLGGGFTEIGMSEALPVSRVWLARLSAPTAARQLHSVASDGMTFTWQSSGAFPLPAQVDFAYSADGISFTPIGAGVWNGNGWQASGSGAPFNQEFFVRVEGAHVSGIWNASGSRPESMARVFVPGGALEVLTEVDPPGLTPQWQVDVIGNTVFSDTLFGADTTGVRGLGPGVYTVTLSAGNETVMADYRITYRCTIDGESGPAGEGISASLRVEVNDSATCTFTTVRRAGLLEVQHVIDPSAPTSDWTLRVVGPTAFTSTLTGNDSTGARVVFTGVYTLDLTHDSGFDYTTSYRCNSNEQTVVSGEGGQATLDITENQQVICIFTSVYRQASNFLPLITR